MLMFQDFNIFGNCFAGLHHITSFDDHNNFKENIFRKNMFYVFEDIPFLKNQQKPKERCSLVVNFCFINLLVPLHLSKREHMHHLLHLFEFANMASCETGLSEDWKQVWENL